MCALLYRPEQFGAVVAKGDGEDVLLLDHDGANAFLQLAGLSNGDETAFQQTTVDGASYDALKTIVSTEGNFHLFKSNKGRLKSFPTLSYPLDLYWEVTRRCNERCVHCYNNSDNTGPHPTSEQISTTLKELENVQLRSLTITGGEPMMRKDFWTIAEQCRPISYKLVLGTNGTLINEGNADKIAELFDFVNVSLDTNTAEEFDLFRGYPGAFVKTTSAIRLLSERGVQVVVQSVLTRRTIDAVKELGYLVAELGGHTWTVRFPFYSGRAMNSQEQFLSHREVQKYVPLFDEVRSELSSRIPSVRIGAGYTWSYEKPYEYTDNPNQLMLCAAATVNAALSADGSLAPCSLFTETAFRSESVWKTSLQHEWQNADCFVAMRNIKLRDIGGCGTCSNALGQCGSGCRAKAYMKYGTIYKSDYDCGYSSADGSSEYPIRFRAKNVGAKTIG
ncbi:radical SAM/SPASM domain-containing protein [Paraburkholderia aromaticivorans]|uniref:radical SAM/SPASM domain-containing protein n=1 Tax=Paraburkholderia aromaticivorans TaxID=2026199 RepID=UPI00145613A2|nr:radical SAM protein [Paraburkholderia aromaticivorans]